MKAIVTVIGKDNVGIIAKVAERLADFNVNIEDISQTVLQEYFVMILLADISKSKAKLTDLSENMDELAKSIGVSIRVQHEDIFNVMHKI